VSEQELWVHYRKRRSVDRATLFFASTWRCDLAILATVQRNATEFQLFVFGHTHEAESAFTTMQGTLSEWQPIAINTGAWQRVISAEDLETWRAGRRRGDVLSAQPDALPPCYSVVVVRPYKSKPTAQLRYWTRRGGSWQLANACSPVA